MCFYIKATDPQSELVLCKRDDIKMLLKGFSVLNKYKHKMVCYLFHGFTSFHNVKLNS